MFVSSDMEGIEQRINQDTIFEGEILCRILSKKYPEIQFKNFSIRCSIYNHDQLTKCYRQLFGKIKREQEFDRIIYCDAGGTSQQKFVSKVLLEYMFEPTVLETWYVKQTEFGKSELVPSEINEYRKIIDLEQIKVLIENSEYYAAQTLGKDFLTEEQMILIEYAYFRFNLAYDDAKKQANKLLNQKKINLKGNTLLIESSQLTSSINHDDFLEFIDSKYFFILREMLMLAKRFEQLNRFSHCVLTYNQFVEHFLYSTILKMGFDTRKFYNELPVDEIYEKFPNVKDKFKRITNISVPLQIEMAMHTSNLLCQSILEHIARTNFNFKYYSKTLSGKSVVYLDSRRNRFAHEGKMVTKEDFLDMPYLHDLNSICNYFLIPDKNNYEVLNDIIIDALM